MNSAVISPCGKYRYRLTRHIPCVMRWIRPCAFIMLNPSTADATFDDPTIRRCMAFAKEWQSTSLTVVNLFALRATNPKDLWIVADPVGPDNDQHVREVVEETARLSGNIIVAWGAAKIATGRDEMLDYLGRRRLHCLGVNKNGSPKHPLYVPGTQGRQWWSNPASACEPTE